MNAVPGAEAFEAPDLGVLRVSGCLGRERRSPAAGGKRGTERQTLEDTDLGKDSGGTRFSFGGCCS
jgi:hypothetical protein